MGAGGQRQNPAVLPPPPKETRYPFTGGWVKAPRPIWTCAENLAPTCIRSRKVQSLYRLSNPGAQCGDQHV